MKYTFRPSADGKHIRTADGVRGTLSEHPDNAAIRPATALVNAADYTPLNTPAPARELSKLVIRRKLREMGKEVAFDAALDAVPHARTDWDDAQVILTSDPLFTTSADALKQAVGLTSEQLNELIY